MLRICVNSRGISVCKYELFIKTNKQADKNHADTQEISAHKSNCAYLLSSCSFYLKKWLSTQLSKTQKASHVECSAICKLLHIKCVNPASGLVRLSSLKHTVILFWTTNIYWTNHFALFPYIEGKKTFPSGVIFWKAKLDLIRSTGNTKGA